VGASALSYFLGRLLTEKWIAGWRVAPFQIAIRMTKAKIIWRIEMNFINLCKGMAVGAALMYVFDPKQGRHRRDALRNRINSYVETTSDALTSATERVTDISRSAADRAQSLLPRKKANRAFNRILTGAAGGALAAYGLKKRWIH
jgi:hypothetical protein